MLPVLLCSLRLPLYAPHESGALFWPQMLAQHSQSLVRHLQQEAPTNLQAVQLGQTSALPEEHQMEEARLRPWPPAALGHEVQSNKIVAKPTAVAFARGSTASLGREKAASHRPPGRPRAADVAYENPTAGPAWHRTHPPGRPASSRRCLQRHARRLRRCNRVAARHQEPLQLLPPPVCAGKPFAHEACISRTCACRKAEAAMSIWQAQA
jgi:hypothetical protein